MGSAMKKHFLKMALAASAAFAITGTANAAVTSIVVDPNVTNYAQDLAAVDDSQIIWDFDGLERAGFMFTPISASNVGTQPNDARAPTGDDTVYGAVRPGISSPSVLTSQYALNAFSFFVGSPDTYNRIVFYNTDGTVFDDLAGAELFPGLPTNGSDIARRITYNFGGHFVDRIEFYSTSDAFEFDRLSAPVPEPATWAMMLMGFFGLGSLIRSRRSQALRLA